MRKHGKLIKKTNYNNLEIKKEILAFTDFIKSGPLISGMKNSLCLQHY